MAPIQLTVVAVSLLFISVLVLPAEYPAGSKLRIDNALLAKLLPEVKNPRLMTVDDLGDDKEFFEVDGFSFILEGDFDKDGKKDYAVAGKDEDTSYAFILVLTMRQGKPVVRYFRSLRPLVRVSLDIRRDCHKGYDAIDLAFTLRSDHGIYLVWDGKRYVTIEVCDR